MSSPQSSHNSSLLKDFVTYCQRHPQERFWQALRNWAGLETLASIQKRESHIQWETDTFYWEGRNG